MRRGYKWGYTILFTILFILSININPSYTQSIIQNVYIEVNVDGSTTIYYKLFVPNPPQDVSITLPDEPIFFTVYVNGSETPAYYEDGRLSFYAVASDVEIEILSNGLTKKDGFKWVFQVNMPYSYKLILPKNTIILNISIQDFTVSVEPDGRPSLLLPKGEISIVYTFPPASVEDGGESTPLGIDFNIIPIFIVFGILLIALLYLLRRRGGNPIEVELLEGEIDDRDKMILEVLKSGMKTAQQIMDETGIPKSPLDRRLNKLERMGYIASTRKSGVKYFYLKKRFE